MKNKCFLSVFVLLILFFVSASCFAQSSGNEQRLVGTWIFLYRDGASPLVFNSNGTVSGYSFYTHWAAAGDTLVFYRPNDDNSNSLRFQISSDGRTLIIGNSSFRRA
jgi:hypothetical protein